jgi:cytochrome c biogenesis protein CcmG/thiol:disulfide interchange protein DsbE
MDAADSTSQSSEQVQSYIPSQTWLIASVILLVVGGAWIWLSKAPPGSTSNNAIPAPRQGFAAPDFSLESADGSIVTLSELRGRPVLVNLWASWCPPCRSEMPAMQEVYEEYQDAGFVILAVNSTYQDDPNDALAFVDELGLSFPILFDADGSVSHRYQSRALPTSFVIDQEGIIQEVVVGGPMADALLRIRVEQLIKRESQ